MTTGDRTPSAGRTVVRVEDHRPIARPESVELLDVVLTRDTWMHRIDVAAATGRPLELTAAHDGRLVADVVAEWARRHGQPFRLHLGGPAGGDFAHGDAGEELTLDAVEFCRILAGRLPGEGLLAPGSAVLRAIRRPTPPGPRSRERQAPRPARPGDPHAPDHRSAEPSRTSSTLDRSRRRCSPSE